MYGVVARPHVAKDMLPGNNGWRSPVWAQQRERLINNPELFKNLDVAALASDVTHPNESFRREVNEAYLEIIRNLTPRGLCGTTPIIPYTSDPDQKAIADTFNMLVGFDK